MLKRWAFCVVAATALSLGGCTGSALYKYNRIDPSEKTMSIPPNNAPLIAALKQGLLTDGWEVTDSFSRAPEHRARYRLDIRQAETTADHCGESEPIVKFFLVVYDTGTHDASFWLRGRDCSDDAAQLFLDTTRNFLKHPRPQRADE